MAAPRLLRACGTLLGAAILPATAQQPGGLGGFGGGGGGGGDDLGNLLGSLMGGAGGGGGGGDLGGLFGGGQDAPLCKKGQFAVPKEGNHKSFSANGCGPQGMRIDENHGLFRCCNFHDICFSVCGTTHAWCEKQFEKCMKRVCKQPESGEKGPCKEQASSFSSMTKMFGSGFHSSSQKDSCTCVKEDEVHKSHRSYLTNFLMEYNQTAAEEDNVSELLNKWSGKEGEMYALLAKKYGRQFVTFDGIPAEFEGHRKDEL